jgi:hypothetical protein
VEAAKDEARRHGKKAVTENRHPRDGTDLYDVPLRPGTPILQHTPPPTSGKPSKAERSANGDTEPQAERSTRHLHARRVGGHA